MGTLDASRFGGDKPVDTFLTANVLTRLVDVATGRLFVHSAAWVPEDSSLYEGGNSEARPVRLTGRQFRYGLPVQVDPDLETHDLEVGGLFTAKYADVNVRFGALTIDGSVHRLGLSGGTTATHNVGTIPVGARAFYSWTLDLEQVRHRGAKDFVLFLLVDAEYDGVQEHYYIWTNKTRHAPGKPSPARMGLVAFESYPDAPPSMAGHFTKFSTDWGQQPVELVLQQLGNDPSTSVWLDAYREGLDYDQEPVYLAGLCVGDTTGGVDDYVPDMVWMEPWMGTEFLAVDPRKGLIAVAAADQEYYRGHRVEASGLGELVVEALAVAGSSGTFTSGGETKIQEPWPESTFPVRNLTAATRALGAGRPARSVLASRLLYQGAEGLFLERTPVLAWDNQELQTTHVRIGSVADYSLFTEPVWPGQPGNTILRPDDATVYTRDWVRIRFLWQMAFRRPVEEFLVSVKLVWRDGTGSTLRTDTLEGALSVGKYVNRHVDGDQIEPAASAGKGFWYRSLYVAAGFNGHDDGTVAKNWPSSDTPHRFLRAAPWNEYKFLQPEFFNHEALVPGSAETVEVLIRPFVGTSYFDIRGTDDNLLVILHRDIRTAPSGAWGTMTS